MSQLFQPKIDWVMDLRAELIHWFFFLFSKKMMLWRRPLIICYETTSLCSPAARPVKMVSTHYLHVTCTSSFVLKIEFFLSWIFLCLYTAVQREHDVQESILFMAKQSGNVDPDVRHTVNEYHWRFICMYVCMCTLVLYVDHPRPGRYGGWHEDAGLGWN